MNWRSGAGVVVLLILIAAVYTGIAYAWSKRSGFVDADFGAFNATTTDVGGDSSVRIGDAGAAYPITPHTIRHTAIQLADIIRERGGHQNLIINIGPYTPRGADTAVIMATLMALGSRYEDARQIIFEKKKDAHLALVYDRLLVNWDISRLGGSAW